MFRTRSIIMDNKETRILNNYSPNNALFTSNILKSTNSKHLIEVTVFENSNTIVTDVDFPILFTDAVPEKRRKIKGLTAVINTSGSKNLIIGLSYAYVYTNISNDSISAYSSKVSPKGLILYASSSTRTLITSVVLPKRTTEVSLSFTPSKFTPLITNTTDSIGTIIGTVLCVDLGYAVNNGTGSFGKGLKIGLELGT